MDVTALLDVAIGVGIVYLGASLFVTVIGEYVSQAFNLRGRVLWDSIRRLITDPDLRARLAASPALQPFFGASPTGDAPKNGRRAPTYVDPVVVARVMLGPGGPGSTHGKPELPPALQAVVGAVGDKTEEAVQAVSHWVDSSLTVLGEKYKRNQQLISFAIGAVIAVVLNLDTIALVRHLYVDKEARGAAVAVALDVTSKVDRSAMEKCIALPPRALREAPECARIVGLVEAVQLHNDALGRLPLGWGSGAAQTAPSAAPGDRKVQMERAQGTEGPVVVNAVGVEAPGGHASPSRLQQGLRAVGDHLVGWILTALALALGAPFWFDLLSRFVNVRHGMRRPAVTPAAEATDGR